MRPAAAPIFAFQRGDGQSGPEEELLLDFTPPVRLSGPSMLATIITLASIALVLSAVADR
jgi:hypothetical protein